MDDLLDVQDEIAMNVLAETQVELTEGEQALVRKRETSNLKALEKHNEGVMYLKRFNRDANLKARQLGEEAIRLDPNFSGAYRGVAGCHFWDITRGWSQDYDKSRKLATEYAQKALALDENNSHNLILWSSIYIQKGDHEKTIELCKRAVEMNPNDPLAIGNLSGALFNAGRYEEAIPLWEQLGRLSPFPSVVYYRNLGLFYWFTNRYEEAITVSKKALHIDSDDITTFRNLAAIYAAIGNEDEARAASAEVLRLEPTFTIEGHFKNMPWKDKQGMERYKDALRSAGLK
jgi:adenylate cyclase